MVIHYGPVVSTCPDALPDALTCEDPDAVTCSRCSDEAIWWRIASEPEAICGCPEPCQCFDKGKRTAYAELRAVLRSPHPAGCGCEACGSLAVVRSELLMAAALEGLGAGPQRRCAMSGGNGAGCPCRRPCDLLHPDDAAEIAKKIAARHGKRTWDGTPRALFDALTVFGTAERERQGWAGDPLASLARRAEVA